MCALSRDPRHDPQQGDVIATANGNSYRVVERGVAGSVRFVRTKGAHRLTGQKSLSCWHRLAAGARVVAPR